MNRIKDIRDYITILKSIGELQEIDEEVDLNLEIGAIIRRVCELRAPAPLFNKIKGIQNGARVLGAPAGLSSQKGLKMSRIACSLGFKPDTDPNEIVNTLANSIIKEGIQPVTVKEGICHENLYVGEEVDLTSLPAPYIHKGDAGRYFNTWGTVVVETPDKTWTNWSIARIMLIDKNRMTGLVAPQQHLGIIHKMWNDRGKPTPFALALGCEPAVPFFSATPLPENVSEADIMGAHFGEPVEVVPCKTVDLEVPATCEIVIEGTISDTEKISEGPMGEFAGYMGEAHPEPVFKATAITHRNNPILPVVSAGFPVEDTQTCCGIMYSALLLAELRKKGFPATSCFGVLESALHWFVVTVSRTDLSEKYALKLTHAAKDIIFESKPGVDIPKVILLDDDIDPSNLNEVIWAYATRCHPDTDAHLYTHEKTMPLVHYLNAAEKKDMSSTKVIYNGLIPSFDSSHIVSFKHNVPHELQNKVIGNWRKYGYSE
ncbi:MAG: UbiD family decarboxylase [Deltaproteobacteria bacterium]